MLGVAFAGGLALNSTLYSKLFFQSCRRSVVFDFVVIYCRCICRIREEMWYSRYCAIKIYLLLVNLSSIFVVYEVSKTFTLSEDFLLSWLLGKNSDCTVRHWCHMSRYSQERPVLSLELNKFANNSPCSWDRSKCPLWPRVKSLCEFLRCVMYV